MNTSLYRTSKHSTKHPLLLAFSKLIVIVSCGSLLLVDIAAAETAPTLERSIPHKMIEVTTTSLTSRLTNLTDEQRKDPSSFEKIVREVIVPIIDFDTFTKLMMGKSAFLQASKEERKTFSHNFSENLIQTYSMGLSLYKNQKIELKPFEAKDLQGNKARVYVELVTADNKRYPMSFSFRKNKSGEWKAINIVIAGVNMGKVFQGMFKEILARNDGDVSKVIVNWNTEINRSVSGIFGKDENDVDNIRAQAQENLKKCGVAICDESERKRLLSPDNIQEK